MSCDDVRQELSLGNAVSGKTAEHVQSCAGCSRLVQALRTPTEMPDQGKLAAIQERMLVSLKPVHPLPSNGKLIILALLFFVVLVNAVTMLFGYQGFEHMSGVQRLWYCATILLLAVAFTRAVSEQFIPGQRALVGVIGPIVGSVALLGLLVSTLFPQFDTASFIARGIPCLRLGLACASLCSLLLFPLVRKGYSPSPLLAGSMVAAFGGLAGVGVLALHCPFQNAAHIIVWHLGAIALSSLIGILLVRIVQLVRS